MKRKILVVSAVNLTEGGPLTVLYDCLNSASELLGKEWTIIALLNNKSVFQNNKVKVLPLPKSKKSWFVRLYYEFIIFKKISKRLNPDLWFSMHDITPSVVAKNTVVYCHNPSPFYQPLISEIIFDPKIAVFSLLYKYLYKINIKSNNFVIVQQGWLRDKFISMYEIKNVIVAHPHIMTSNIKQNFLIKDKDNDKLVLLYPAFPRVFKNIDLICKAVIELPTEIKNKIEVRLTISGAENRYAANLYNKYAAFPFIKFIGRQNKFEMNHHYNVCDVVLFPSKLETWGLPISEAKARNKPLLVADLNYARETVGEYSDVSFLNPFSPSIWADAISSIVKGNHYYSGNKKIDIREPFASDWCQLWSLLMNLHSS